MVAHDDGVLVAVIVVGQPVAVTLGKQAFDLGAAQRARRRLFPTAALALARLPPVSAPDFRALAALILCPFVRLPYGLGALGTSVIRPLTIEVRLIDGRSYCRIALFVA
jgi:hypothetical protein